MPNGRCRFHGGKSTGPPKGSRNGLKHGIYTDGLLPGEELILPEIKLGQLDDELVILRLQLRRALLAQKAANGSLEVDQETHRRGVGPEGPVNVTETKSVAKDYSAAIDRLAGRIGKLESQRAQIIGELPHPDTDKLVAALSGGADNAWNGDNG